MNKNLTLIIGEGAIMDGKLITFDYEEGEKLKPYLCEIQGRDFKYGFKREFAKKKFTEIVVMKHGRKVRMIEFELKPHIAYEYKRFMGKSYGEIEEGYFVILSNEIKQLEYEEVMYWCGTAKEKEKALAKQRQKTDKKGKFAPDDIDF